MEVSQELAERVLQWVGAATYRPSKAKQIAAGLGIDADAELRELKRVVKWLVAKKKLRYGPNHLILGLAGDEANGPSPKNRSTANRSDAAAQQALADRGSRAGAIRQSADAPGATESESSTKYREAPNSGSAVAMPAVVEGTFRRAMGGFGFVRLTQGVPGAETLDDVFIPPGRTAGALEGDTVRVRIEPRLELGGDGAEGMIEEIVKRGRRQFTGTFEFRGGQAIVHLDGLPYDQPITVGDVRGLPLEGDEKVFVELVQFPDITGRGGEGVILEVLGKTNNPAIDTLSIMRQYALPESFPDAVLEDARRQADLYRDESDPENVGFAKEDEHRRDLTELLTLTIDPFDARDFDDAISLTRGQGRYTLWVHIADVSTFVVEGSPLDAEAERRATSVYLPDRVVPMIPEIISNHLASLQPDRVRLTKTVEIEIQDDGVVSSVEIYNSTIRSDIRLNYEQVDEFLADPASKREAWGGPVCELLTHMHQLAMTMRRRRFNRGSLTMEVPEVKIDLDKNGKVKGAHLVKYTESHQIIEEFMLAANQAVATWLDDQELHFLRRIHPAPERRKLRQLEQFVREIGVPVKRVESRFEIQKVLDLVAGTTLEDAVNFAVLRSMNKAIYGPQREGHYALDMEHYCHFTSPIRRYPDLTVHRLIQRLIEKNQTPDDPFPKLLSLGFHCSDQERNAASAERDLVLLKLLHFMKKKIGDTMDAVISRVFPDGFHARCLQLPVDGFVPVTSLPQDRYRYERSGQMVVGFKDGNQFRLGDRIVVRIAKVDMQQRQLWMEFVKKSSQVDDLPWKRPALKSVRAESDGRLKRDKVSKMKSKKSRKRH